MPEWFAVVIDWQKWQVTILPLFQRLRAASGLSAESFNQLVKIRTSE